MGLNNSQKDKVSQLYHEMHDMLFSYANSVFKNKDLAEEAVQDTFRIACGKVESMLTSNNPRGWLVNTLKNVIRTTEYERATLNRLVVASLSIDDETFVQEREAANCTDKRLEDANIDLIYSDLLTPEEYKLLKMVAVHGYTVREAAAEFGINIEVCKKRVQRAKKKMKKILEEK